MLNCMFRPKKVIISFTQIEAKLLHIFDENKLLYIIGI
jgi:hypothetical protein